MSIKTEGACTYCKENFAKNAVARHIINCAVRKELNSKDNGNERIFLIKAGAIPFWVYFEVNASETLLMVDDFLRDLWLECCGHLSLFKINGIVYAYDPQPEHDDKSMKISLDKVLDVGTNFSHEYDFGTTTYLELQCISERKGKIKGVNIIARNNLPDFRCKCGQQAKEICTECLWEKGEEAMLCEQCAKDHECDKDMFLPVVNSPRMGMCGYTGE